jgi:hypothetical protein
MLFCFTSGSEQDAHRGNRNQPRQRAENRHDHSVCPTAFLYWRTAPMGRDKAVFGCVVSDLRARRLMSGAHRRRGSRFLWGIPVFRSVDMDVGGNWSRAPRRRGFSRIKIGIRHERTPCPRQQRLRSAQVPRQACSRPIASARHPKPPAIEVDARIRARPAISTSAAVARHLRLPAMCERQNRCHTLVARSATISEDASLSVPTSGLGCVPVLAYVPVAFAVDGFRALGEVPPYAGRGSKRG